MSVNQQIRNGADQMNARNPVGFLDAGRGTAEPAEGASDPSRKRARGVAGVSNGGGNSAGRDRGGRNGVKRQIPLGDESQVQPAESQENLGETPVARVRQRHHDRENHQRLEVNRDRRMKVHRLELSDVVERIRVDNIFDDMLMQLPAIGVNERHGETGGKGDQPRPKSGQPDSAGVRVFFYGCVHQTVGDIAQQHQKDDEEPAVEISPEQR